MQYEVERDGTCVSLMFEETVCCAYRGRGSAHCCCEFASTAVHLLRQTQSGLLT